MARRARAPSRRNRTSQHPSSPRGISRSTWRSRLVPRGEGIDSRTKGYSGRLRSKSTRRSWIYRSRKRGQGTGRRSRNTLHSQTLLLVSRRTWTWNSSKYFHPTRRRTLSRQSSKSSRSRPDEGRSSRKPRNKVKLTGFLPRKNSGMLLRHHTWSASVPLQITRWE